MLQLRTLSIQMWLRSWSWMFKLVTPIVTSPCGNCCYRERLEGPSWGCKGKPLHRLHPKRRCTTCFQRHTLFSWRVDWLSPRPKRAICYLELYFTWLSVLLPGLKWQMIFSASSALLQYFYRWTKQIGFKLASDVWFWDTKRFSHGSADAMDDI